MKAKSIFYCTNCDYRPAKWLGCCPSCQEWSSIVEKAATPAISTRSTALSAPAALTPLENINMEVATRLRSGINEWDRVMGGGIIPGSLLIVTGDPGIGKSTLLLQIAHNIAQEHTVFYFSSEESLEQVKVRAVRIGCAGGTILFSDLSHIEGIIALSSEQKPALIIVDSIQNCYTSTTTAIPGTIGQLREAAFQLMRFAKENKIAVIVTGHITKEGTIAGPKLLEHMVDGVFYLQGEDRWQMRVLRSVKNRFGAAHEIGFFHMEEAGMAPVDNINQQLLSSASHQPGSVLISSIEGSRPLLIELQALTVPSKFGVPQRVISGVDHKQVIIICAILEKYLKIKFSAHDLFVKVSGGFKLHESSADLGIALALLSSYFQKPLPEKIIALGEVNLTGQIKPINQFNLHLTEAEKFGIAHLFIAYQQKSNSTSIDLSRFKSVYELIQLFNV
jgi:DNA repair protein RadA/Sms